MRAQRDIEAVAERVALAAWIALNGKVHKLQTEITALEAQRDSWSLSWLREESSTEQPPERYYRR